MHFWWFQGFPEICIFPSENAVFFCFSASCRKCIFHISLILSKPRFSWIYAFLMVPRLSRNMHSSMGKCIFSPFRKIHAPISTKSTKFAFHADARCDGSIGWGHGHRCQARGMRRAASWQCAMGCGVSEHKKQSQSLLELFDGSIVRAVWCWSCTGWFLWLRGTSSGQAVMDGNMKMILSWCKPGGVMAGAWWLS